MEIPAIKNFRVKESRSKIIFVNTGCRIRRTKSPREKGFSMTIEFSQEAVKREVGKSIPRACPSSRRSLEEEQPALRYESLVNVFRGSGLSPAFDKVRSGRGNGLLSERLEDRRLIGHLNEVPSGGRREKWSFSMRTVPRTSSHRCSAMLRRKIVKT